MKRLHISLLLALTLCALHRPVAADDDDLCQGYMICDHVVKSVKASMALLCKGDECSCEEKLRHLTEGEVAGCMREQHCDQQPSGTDTENDVSDMRTWRVYSTYLDVLEMLTLCPQELGPGPEACCCHLAEIAWKQMKGEIDALENL